MSVETAHFCNPTHPVVISEVWCVVYVCMFHDLCVLSYACVCGGMYMYMYMYGVLCTCTFLYSCMYMYMYMTYMYINDILFLWLSL